MRDERLERRAPFGSYMCRGQNNFFFDVPQMRRLRILGWFDACPRPKDVAKKFGVDWTLARYSECNLLGAFILDRAGQINPILAQRLNTYIQRPSNEKPRNFDPESVPQDYAIVVYPGSTPWGYAASRVLIEQFGREKPWEIGDPRTTRGVDILYDAFEKASHPAEFLALLAGNLSKENANPTAVLGHIFAVEFDEEGVLFLAKQVATEVQKRAPELWQHYLSLSSKERKKAGILQPSKIGS